MKTPVPETLALLALEKTLAPKALALLALEKTLAPKALALLALEKTLAPKALALLALKKTPGREAPGLLPEGATCRPPRPGSLAAAPSTEVKASPVSSSRPGGDADEGLQPLWRESVADSRPAEREPRPPPRQVLCRRRVLLPRLAPNASRLRLDSRHFGPLRGRSRR
jgi:hypothetical protein